MTILLVFLSLIAIIGFLLWELNSAHKRIDKIETLTAHLGSHVTQIRNNDAALKRTIITYLDE